MQNYLNEFLISNKNKLFFEVVLLDIKIKKTVIAWFIHSFFILSSFNINEKDSWKYYKTSVISFFCNISIYIPQKKVKFKKIYLF